MSPPSKKSKIKYHAALDVSSITTALAPILLRWDWTMPKILFCVMYTHLLVSRMLEFLTVSTCVGIKSLWFIFAELLKLLVLVPCNSTLGVQRYRWLRVAILSAV